MKKTTRKLHFMPYANARVTLFEDGTIQLTSYNTITCVINAEGDLLVTGLYSATTRRHIGAFMREYGNGSDYYTAKMCYTDDITYNIFTGEVKRISH